MWGGILIQRKPEYRLLLFAVHRPNEEVTVLFPKANLSTGCLYLLSTVPIEENGNTTFVCMT
jgi:hypothetical protein